jgi:CBS domain-containing protein
MKTFVKDVMTASVIWVERDTPFAAIAAALREYRVSAFPVLDEKGQVIGVVSESDLLAKLALGGGEDGMPGMITGILHQHQTEKARAVTAGDLMTSPAETVSPDDTLEHAARLMYLRKVKRLPVVDTDNHLAGIVSRADVLAFYDRPDVEIGEEIRNDIAVCESHADAGRIDVMVTDGVVTLTGRPRTCDQGHDIIRRARHVQGVVAVRDRLDYPPPGPGTFDVLAGFSTD